MKIQLSDHFTYRKILRFCLSPALMMVFTSIYGVVDGFFVSNYVGKVPFAALNLVMPYIMLLAGVGFMLGTGGTALVAKTLGAGKSRLANQYFSMIIEALIICGIAIASISFILMPDIARLLGADEEMLPYCVLYARISLLSTPFYMLQSSFQSFLSSAEKPQLGLYFTLISGCINMLLDWLLVGVLGIGIAGAAMATACSEIIGAIMPFIFFARKNDSLLQLRPVRISIVPVLKSCGNGISEMMTSISSSLVGILYNMQLIKYAGADGVAAYGVLMYVQFVFLAIMIGYTIGISPVISYHYGADNKKELHSLLCKSLVITALLGIIQFVIAEVCAGAWARLFVGYDEGLFSMVKQAFRIFAVGFLLSGFNILGSAFFTALNNGAVSAAVSFIRTLIFQSTAVMLLPLVFGINGIWGANLAAEIAAITVSSFFLVKMQPKYGY